MERNAGTQRTARGGRQRKPNRLLLARRRRTARKAEAYIASYKFPAHISRRAIRRTPQLDETSWEMVEQGLREWFVCCAWRGRTVLGMPSRLVDEAWHEFILDSLSYTRFCDTAFGGYLHHTPDEAISTPMGDAVGDTIRAWDRSGMGANEESVLWDLDDRIGIEQPLRVSGLQLSAARSRSPYPIAGGWACGGAVGDSGSGAGADGGCGGGGSCNGGSSCGGGGCGGGGCGGGGS
jgi:uncharacterized membrane protein YgcG